MTSSNTAETAETIEAPVLTLPDRYGIRKNRREDLFRVYIGWDPRDDLAAAVAARSCRPGVTGELDVIFLREHRLRRAGLYTRNYMVQSNGQMVDCTDGRPYSTQFAFTRFLIPAIEQYQKGWVLFVDADVLFRHSLQRLLHIASTMSLDRWAVLCVQHEASTAADGTRKMDGVLDRSYARKNWSSVMMLNPGLCSSLTPDAVNTRPGSWLHGMEWVDPERIGHLPCEFNYLVGTHTPLDAPDPTIVHFTKGTPDMQSTLISPYDAEWWQVARSLTGVL